MVEYRLLIRDEALRLVHEVGGAWSFEATTRFNDAGGWVLDIGADHPAVAYLSPRAKGGVVLLRDDVVILSGPVRRLHHTFAEDGADTVQISGITDLGRLAERKALPTPAGPPYADDHAISGVASTVIRSYVDANAGPGATIPRQIRGLVLDADPAVGTAVAGHARFDNLLDQIRDLAVQGGGLCFDIIQSPDAPELVFTVEVPADRAAETVFSRDRGNLRSAEYDEASPTANWIYAAGEGEADQRVIDEDGDAASIAAYDRFEGFLDARSVGVTELPSKIAEALGGGRENISLDLTAQDTESVQYGRDYEMGDQVSADLDTIQLAAWIYEVKIAISADGVVVTPQLSTTPGSPGGDDLDDVAVLAGRISNLERNTNTGTPGMVVGWTGAVGSIPAGWQLGNNTGGAPNTLGRVAIGAGGAYALGATGGAASVSIVHNHSMQDHNHGVSGTTAQNTDSTGFSSGGTQGADDNHSHEVTGTTQGPSVVNTGDSSVASIDVRQPYFGVYHIWRKAAA